MRPPPDQTIGKHQNPLTLRESLVRQMPVRVNTGDTTGMAAGSTRGGACPASPRSTPTTRSVPTTDRPPITGSVPTTDLRMSPVTSFERERRRRATRAKRRGADVRHSRQISQDLAVSEEDRTPTCLMRRIFVTRLSQIGHGGYRLGYKASMVKHGSWRAGQELRAGQRAGIRQRVGRAARL